MVNNPYSAYKNNSVLTASPEELTLMLYEGAIKFSNQAIVAIEQKDIQRTHNLIIRVEDIISELRVTLNKDYPIAEQLDQIYDYLLRRLTEANFKKDKEIIEEVNEHIRELRDTWKEAMKIAKVGKV
ncbi:flagellar export chaperone FliS [Vallitalea okinawensis]|uniref:flagellar export chaperone FliS n=1 Tax=Vallitalea okinawensis TaxID=2078660 RepID=UPI000CFADA55|nr:flagellar export chaperone FliS [Vallitalea okinawensis]